MNEYDAHAAMARRADARTKPVRAKQPTEVKMKRTTRIALECCVIAVAALVYVLPLGML